MLIADDNVQFCRRLASILSGIGGIEIVGQAGDVLGVIEAIEVMKPDTVIQDIHIPGGNGLDVLALVKAKNPSPTVVMLTIGPKSEYRTMSFLAGAEYFFNKSSDLKKMFLLFDNLSKKSPVHSVERAEL